MVNCGGISGELTGNERANGREMSPRVTTGMSEESTVNDLGKKRRFDEDMDGGCAANRPGMNRDSSGNLRGMTAK